MFAERFKRKLTARREENLLRDPPVIETRAGKHVYIDGRRVLNFSSNDYLGLGVSRALGNRVAENFRRYHSSASSSRLVSANYSLIRRAEKEYARYFGYEDALFFPSGYQANIGVLSAFFDKKDTIIFDKHIHASSVKGMALSGAAFRGYRHNSMAHLEKRLRIHAQGPTAVLTESLFSMDGDMLHIEAFGKIRRQYHFVSIVDEAHAFGALGDKGRGLARDVADIAVGTFGKALGFFGAFVLLPEQLKEYLFNFSSPLIYSTSLPEAHAASAMDILEIIHDRDDLRMNLREVSHLMKESLIRRGFRVTGDRHILAVEIGREDRAVAVAKHLLGKGVLVLPARFPTVPLNRALLRVSMTALHTEADIGFFVNTLAEVFHDTGPADR